MKTKILVIDDEEDMLRLLKRSLEPDLDCRVETAPSGLKALEKMSSESFDLVLADIKMPGMDGMELLERIKESHPGQTVVMMTAHGSIDAAVAAIKTGAYDFVTKPFDHEALIVRLEKALERARLLNENRRLTRQCGQQSALEDMAGKSPAMRRVFETIRTIAQTELTVLITGESGTGKELAARAVHSLSRRSSRPFVAVNCPAVPESILESELFGYKKGAFTHATENRKGLFQEAQGGTLFLDEIGDVSPVIQTKLLRVLQEKEVKPLGDTLARKVDVRIIASTNQDLKAKIRDGSFREDFFYRLAVLPLEMPPLRERRGDLGILAAHLVKKHCHELGKPEKQLSPEFVEWLESLPWEGNIRELENTLIQSILFCEGEVLMPRPFKGASPQPALFQDFSGNYKDAKEKVLQTFHAEYLGRILEETGGNITQAAKNCGMERQNLQQILRRYNISADDYR